MNSSLPDLTDALAADLATPSAAPAAPRARRKAAPAPASETEAAAPSQDVDTPGGSPGKHAEVVPPPVSSAGALVDCDPHKEKSAGSSPALAPTAPRPSSGLHGCFPEEAAAPVVSPAPNAAQLAALQDSAVEGGLGFAPPQPSAAENHKPLQLSPSAATAGERGVMSPQETAPRPSSEFSPEEAAAPVVAFTTIFRRKSRPAFRDPAREEDADDDFLEPIPPTSRAGGAPPRLAQRFAAIEGLEDLAEELGNMVDAAPSPEALAVQMDNLLDLAIAPERQTVDSAKRAVADAEAEAREAEAAAEAAGRAFVRSDRSGAAYEPVAAAEARKSKAETILRGLRLDLQDAAKMADERRREIALSMFDLSVDVASLPRREARTAELVQAAFEAYKIVYGVAMAAQRHLEQHNTAARVACLAAKAAGLTPSAARASDPRAISVFREDGLPALLNESRVLTDTTQQLAARISAAKINDQPVLHWVIPA